jgi:hypothetical protein
MALLRNRLYIVVLRSPALRRTLFDDPRHMDKMRKCQDRLTVELCELEQDGDKCCHRLATLPTEVEGLGGMRLIHSLRRLYEPQGLSITFSGAELWTWRRLTDNFIQGFCACIRIFLQQLLEVVACNLYV